jgi:hypothetical protein
VNPRAGRAGLRNFDRSIERRCVATSDFDQVVTVVRNRSRDLPGSNLRTNTALLIALVAGLHRGDFAALNLYPADGTAITLGEVATVIPMASSTSPCSVR